MADNRSLQFKQHQSNCDRLRCFAFWTIWRCAQVFSLLSVLRMGAGYASEPVISQSPQDAVELNSGSTAEESLLASPASGRHIESISIQNPLGRTLQSYVRAKLGLKEGDTFTPEALKKGVQNLRNTRIFRDVHVDVTDGGSTNSVRLELVLEEKWTTLPDLRFGGGGGTAFFRLGVFDINWLGLGIQGLLSYENRNGTHNGDAWFRWPNIWETQNLVGLGITRKTQVLNQYSRDHRIIGGEAMVKTTLLLDFERPLTEYITIGYRMEPEWVDFSTRLVSDEAKHGNEAAGRTASPATRRILHRTQIHLGRINFVGLLAEGIELQTQWLPAFAEFGSDRDLLLTSHQLRLFWTTPFNSYVASRFVYETSSSGRPEDLHRLGGLTEVRGYRDLEFAGRYIAYANIEYRQNLFQTWSLMWQPAIFFDTGWAADTPGELTQAQARDAVGVGIRIVPEFVHLIAVRLDFAFPLSDDRNGGGISFAMLHLF